MGESQKSLNDLLEDPDGLSEDEYERLYSERLLGTTAILLHQYGQAEAAQLMLDVVAVDFDSDYESRDNDSWVHTFHTAVLRVEPPLIPQFTEEILDVILSTMRTAAEKDPSKDIRHVRAGALIPDVSADWREKLAQAVSTAQPTNQVRRVRLEPEHPQDDLLHFTNEWEHRVYIVLKER